MEVLIVGAGAMGRWFADSVDAEVAFADAEHEVARKAATDLGGRAVHLDTDERFAAVVVAVPMRVVTEAIEEHAPRATDAILDLSGVMVDPVAAMADFEELGKASLHPLFAPENAPGRIAAVREDDGPVVADLLEDLEAAGNEVFETTPAEHDRAMETVQAKAHAAVLAFGLAADEVPESFGTPIYDDLRGLLATVTGGTPRVYADIQETFEGAEEVIEAAKRLADAGPEAFEELYREARPGGGESTASDETPRDTSGTEDE